MRDSRRRPGLRNVRRLHRAAAGILPVFLLFACGESGTSTDPGDPPPQANLPPTANFTVDRTQGPAPLAVTLNASQSVDPDGEIVSYEWEFGDGLTGTGRVVNHAYGSPGHFIPKLTVTDDRGALDSAISAELFVSHPPGEGAGTIEGEVWHDRTGNGERAPGDPAVRAMTVFLDLNENGVRDPGEPFTVTGPDGRYAFQGVETDRSYAVTQELGLGWTNTAAGTASSPGPAGVIGGTPAGEAEFPFMVALLFSSVSSNQNAFTCGGTFIASRWVLTAAHCVADRLPPQLEVLVGTNSLTSGGERVPVRTIRVFPDFGTASFVGNDVAVLELDRSFMIPRIDLQPAARPDISAPGTAATAIGWGRTSFSGSISTSLMRVPLPLISNAECQRLLGEQVVDSTICAGQLGGTQSVCSGDSGGPLMVNAEGRWVQVGITSFGAQTCQPPIAWARVSEFTSWIEERVPREPSLSVTVDWSEGDSVTVDFGNFR